MISGLEALHRNCFRNVNEETIKNYIRENRETDSFLNSRKTKHFFEGGQV